MTTIYHSNKKTVLDRRGDPVVVKRPMKECPACLKKCGNCRWPFTLSTALDRVAELFFCSEACAREGLRHD